MLRLLFCLVAVLLSALPARSEDRVRFNRDIRPILSETCFACHGPDKGQRKAGLRLDQHESILKKKILVAGKPAESEIIARLTARDTSRMPPPDSNRQLKPAQIELIRKWIAQGAEFQDHWAYESPVKPAVPGGANGIDHLVRQRLATLKLEPSPEADRRVLIRRLHFDLTGLPPSPEQVEAFVKDTRPDAYEKLVEKLLASPHYGERMAQGWLDVVRFADTIGYHSDNPRNVWPYRDWVIQSFNDNKRFDRFTIEQLAGDLLPNPTQDQKVGSCFNRLLLTTEEGGAQAKDYEARMLADRVRAIGTVWLGQTLGCCQCHDHKFDPFTMRDFYSIGAFFADIQEPILGRREPGLPVADEAAVKKLAELEATLATAKKVFDADKKNAANKAAFEKATREKTAFEATVPRCIVSVSMKTPRTVRVLPRGNWQDDSGDVVQPALPASLARGATTDPKARLTRLDLAKWIAAKDNPLTARVFVNRLWEQFFGIGLSKNLDDLGSQGEPPVHPALLDWLAVEFMDSGWDVKHLVRTIVQSQTYRQTSRASQAALARDPENRDLARQSRWRLEAEQVRDSALAISGLLVPTIGGPSVHPYQPAGYWENLNFPTRSWPTDTGNKQYRRGLYTWWQRTFPHPSMTAFDAPSREECAADRSRSNIPQQALVLLNDPTYVEAARVFAARILREATEPAKRIPHAFRLALQREPTPTELKLLTDLLAETHKTYQADRKAAEALLKVGQAPMPAGLDPVELAAFTSVTRALLNLHETITRN